MQDLVEGARDMIKELWLSMEYGESQKEDFAPYMNSVVYDDELFARHQDYVAVSNFYSKWRATAKHNGS